MFTKITGFDPKKLKTVEQVRIWCENNTCHAYGKNWSCPPFCGTLEECELKMHSYSKGLLLETTGSIKGKLDVFGYRNIEQEHLKNLYEYRDQFEFKDALFLGAGGCRICKNCAYPEPCRYPDKALPSMEGYGLMVKDVCELAGTDYTYDNKHITYYACVLYND